MISSLKILNRRVDPENTMMFTQAAPKEAIIVAAWLTRPHIE
jgi:hypothetical protein